MPEQRAPGTLHRSDKTCLTLVSCCSNPGGVDARANPGTPSPWVTRFATLIPRGGLVLDLACGRGRHTRYLLSRGYRVVAVDIDVSGLDDLRAPGSLEVLAADLEAESWPLENLRFDAIIVTNYLHRPRLPGLAQSLRPSGVLIYETFAKGHEHLGRPRNPDFLLEPGELLDVFAPGLTIVAYEHGRRDNPSPRVTQRICGVRNTEPVTFPP